MKEIDHTPKALLTNRESQEFMNTVVEVLDAMSPAERLASEDYIIQMMIKDTKNMLKENRLTEFDIAKQKRFFKAIGGRAMVIKIFGRNKS